MHDALAGHQLCEAVVVDLGGRERADLPPVAQNGHALGNLDNLLQSVTDEHNGDAQCS